MVPAVRRLDERGNNFLWVSERRKSGLSTTQYENKQKYGAATTSRVDAVVSQRALVSLRILEILGPVSPRLFA